MKTININISKSNQISAKISCLGKPKQQQLYLFANRWITNYCVNKKLLKIKEIEQKLFRYKFQLKAVRGNINV